MADLDLNNLIAERNGGLAAERVTDAEVVDRLRSLESSPGAQWARGVDLAAVRDRQYRQHRWTMLVTFHMPNELVAAMSAQRQEIAELLAQEIDVPSMPPIEIPMGEDNCLEMQGPGCVKCGSLWEHPETGFNTMCAVDDRAFAQAKEQSNGMQALQRESEMNRLVSVERGKLA